MSCPKLDHKPHPPLNIDLNKANSLSCDHVPLWPTLGGSDCLYRQLKKLHTSIPCPRGSGPMSWDGNINPSIAGSWQWMLHWDSCPSWIQWALVAAGISSCLCVSATEVPLPQLSFTLMTLAVLPALDHSLASPTADRDRPMGLDRKFLPFRSFIKWKGSCPL